MTRIIKEMLIIAIAFIAYIKAVDIDPHALSSVAHSLQQSPRMSRNQHNAPLLVNLANSKNPQHNSIQAAENSDMILTANILQSLTFREAINAKVLEEQEIIKYFASKNYEDLHLHTETYEDILEYIFRDLWDQKISDENRINNLELLFNSSNVVGNVTLSNLDIHQIYKYGKLNFAKYLIGKSNFHQFRDVRNLLFLEIDENHLSLIVKRILKQNPSSDNYKFSIRYSIMMDKIPTLATILKTAENRRLSNHIDILSLALANSFFYNRRYYVDYVLSKVSKVFQDPYSSSWFSEKFLNMYSRNSWNPTVENLEYFFSQKVWNPRILSSILTAMSKATENVVDRIGMELLNPRIKFREAANGDTIEKAIEMAALRNQATYARVKQVLENIKRKRSVDVGEKDLPAKRPRLKEPVYLDGFGLGFHPVK